MTKYIIIGLVVIIVVLLIVIRGKNKANDNLDSEKASLHGRDLKKYHDRDSARELANRRWHKK